VRTALVAIWLLALALIAVHEAEARTVVWPDPAPRAHLYQVWVNESLMPTPDGVVRVHTGPDRCGGQRERQPLGCAGSDGTVSLVKPWRHVFLHELGHIFDSWHLTDAQRRWFTRELRFPADTEWRPFNVPAWQSPSEMFATAYEECAYSPLWHLWTVTPFGFAERLFYRRQIARLCLGIKRVGGAA